MSSRTRCSRGLLRPSTISVKPPAAHRMPPSSKYGPFSCLDLDSFFVSVERLLGPGLVGRPVIVGGLPGQRGVVTAASYEVRALGVRSGMSLKTAYELAPNAVYLPTRHGVYGEYATRT